MNSTSHLFRPICQRLTAIGDEGDNGAYRVVDGRYLFTCYHLAPFPTCLACVIVSDVKQSFYSVTTKMITRVLFPFASNNIPADICHNFYLLTYFGRECCYRLHHRHLVAQNPRLYVRVSYIR